MVLKNSWDFPLNRWRDTNIVAWRKILVESKCNGDKNREDYARKMLTEVLEDTEFDKNGL